MSGPTTFIFLTATSSDLHLIVRPSTSPQKFRFTFSSRCNLHLATRPSPHHPTVTLWSDRHLTVRPSPRGPPRPSPSALARVQPHFDVHRRQLGDQVAKHVRQGDGLARPAVGASRTHPPAGSVPRHRSRPHRGQGGEG